LTVDEIPAHSHNVTDPGHTHGYQNTSASEQVSGDGSKGVALNELINHTTSQSTTGITIQETGGGMSHQNMPPYYVLAYIMRIS
jgi:microcystin-dependent protein